MASNITFIIGNGLDISLGLKTSYRDFYSYALNNSINRDNRIYKSIAQDPENWSDFEVALGEYTSYIGDLPESKRESESMIFHEDLEQVREDLANYIESQEKSISDLPDKFTFSATHSAFYDDLNSGQRIMIERILDNPPVYFRFISLNYTSTLEELLAGDKVLTNRGVQLTPPLHLHGDLKTYLTLGVNDESQLYGGMSDQEKKDLIKKDLVESANDGRLESFKKIIGSSKLIVLFGTSIGSTDSYIWKELAEWLLLDQGRRVLIHKHDRNYTPSARLSVRVENTFINRAKNKFLQYSGLDESVQIELKKQIFVIHNTDKLLKPIF